MNGECDEGGKENRDTPKRRKCKLVDSNSKVNGECDEGGKENRRTETHQREENV